MVNTTIDYMNQNKTLWSGNVAITASVTDLTNSVATLGQKQGLQETPVAGAEALKVQVRHDFEEETHLIASQLSALAAVNGDTNLAAQSELTLPQLDKMSDDVLEQTGTRIAALANANIAALADYGITAADVTALNNFVTQFHGVKTAPRTAVAGRAGETKTIPAAQQAVMSILRNRLDKLMVMFRKTNPQFYQGYLSARVIVDRGIRHDAPAPAAVAPSQPVK